MRISDWSSDVCSSDLRIASKVTRYSGPNPKSRLLRHTLCIVDPNAHPGANHRAAANSGRPDKELPRRLTHGPRQSRAKRRFAQRAAIIDTVMHHCLARDPTPPWGGSIGGQLNGQKTGRAVSWERVGP